MQSTSSDVKVGTRVSSGFLDQGASKPGMIGTWSTKLTTVRGETCLDPWSTESGYNASRIHAIVFQQLDSLQVDVGV